METIESGVFGIGHFDPIYSRKGRSMSAPDDEIGDRLGIAFGEYGY